MADTLKLLAIADRIKRQADCLDGFAEQSGYHERPVPSVFHLQSSHFRDLAIELAEAARTMDDAPDARQASTRP
jgi:hypothetical protein